MLKHTITVQCDMCCNLVLLELWLGLTKDIMAGFIGVAIFTFGKEQEFLR